LFPFDYSCRVILNITIIIALFAAVIYLISKSIQKKSNMIDTEIPGQSVEETGHSYPKHILQKVGFYRALNPDEKALFENEVAEFLSKVKIIGIDTDVTDEDRVLVASSAIIPLFAFHDWFYPNIITVELYKDAFNHELETSGPNRRILGMVGGGVMNDRMVLSKKALHIGFNNETDKRNTAIHEFVHLIDKADGYIDGVPELLLDKHNTLPWLEYIREKIAEIHEGDSDIDAYGGTSETEFFAVAAEYFFERPELFEQKHPELYHKMIQLFRRAPEVQSAGSKELPGRNEPCYCGSGKKFKVCHGR
jgi:MtfA peptidase